MLVGLAIAVIAYVVGAPLWLAAGLGIGYAVLAFVVTPRSAFVGGFFGPKPRPGEIPGPGSTREIDLTRESIKQMTAQIRLGLPEISRETGIKFVDASVGNIGRRRGQFGQFVVELSDDFQQAAVERGKVLMQVVQALAPQADDMREGRVRFVDRAGHHIADATVDMSSASPWLTEDEAMAAAYAAAHTRTIERA